MPENFANDSRSKKYNLLGKFNQIYSILTKKCSALLPNRMFCYREDHRKEETRAMQLILPNILRFNPGHILASD
jgi:hypothetical protein